MGITLITGCSGEVGSSLVHHLSEQRSEHLIGTDVREPRTDVRQHLSDLHLGNIADPSWLQEMDARYEFDRIFHLAGILSSSGERNPQLAHQVNVTGTLNVLELARQQSERRGAPVQVILTSTIAVYGISSLEIKQQAGAVCEHEHLHPITMYGANKLYCESLGNYYANFFGLLEENSSRTKIDFRCVRYPGLLNAHTLPTGGTSDYAPEMVHALAQDKPYSCFVRPDTRIPFMMMPDALRALVMLSDAPKERLSRSVYNIAAFSPSAEEISALLARRFTKGLISYDPHARRQLIVDSWPEFIDDTAARNDWGWSANESFEQALDDYLVPAVYERYRTRSVVTQSVVNL
jgi:threonine 3-dehydrogenase